LADPTSLLDPDSAPGRGTLLSDRSSHVFICVGVVHKQDVGCKHDVALKMNGIPGGYRAPFGDTTVILEDNLNLVMALYAGGGPGEEPCLPPDLDTITQPYVRRETTRNLARVV
jgi:hypothetical protein